MSSNGINNVEITYSGLENVPAGFIDKKATNAKMRKLPHISQKASPVMSHKASKPLIVGCESSCANLFASC